VVRCFYPFYILLIRTERNFLGVHGSVLYNVIFLQLILITYGYYYFWQWSIKIAKYYGINHESEILISAICMFIIGVFSHISNLPIVIYDTFVLEQKHGFNKQVRFSIQHILQLCRNY